MALEAIKPTCHTGTEKPRQANIPARRGNAPGRRKNALCMVHAAGYASRQAAEGARMSATHTALATPSGNASVSRQPRMYAMAAASAGIANT